MTKVADKHFHFPGMSIFSISHTTGTKCMLLVLKVVKSANGKKTRTGHN